MTALVDALADALDGANWHRQLYISSRERAVDNLVWLPLLASLYALGVRVERRVRDRLPRVLPYRRTWFDVALALLMVVMLVLSTYVKASVCCWWWCVLSGALRSIARARRARLTPPAST